MERSSGSVLPSLMAGAAGYVVGLLALAIPDILSLKATGMGAVAGAATSALPIGAAIVAFVGTLLLRTRRKP